MDAVVQPSSPLADEAFSVLVEVRDATNTLVSAPSDLAVTIQATGLAPRRLTGKIASGASFGVLTGARFAEAGTFTLSVKAGTYTASPTVTVRDRSFTGQTGAEVSLDTGGPGLSGFSFADLAALDSQAACAFTDQRVSGASHVFVNPSLDAGVTWKGPRRADRAADAVDAWDASVGLDGQGFAVAAWCDARAYETGAVYANVSSNGGQTFAASDVRVDAAATRTGFCSGTRAAMANGRIFIAWIDERDAALGATVWIARSIDQGNTFTETRLDTHAAGASPWVVDAPLSLVACGDDVSVLWVEKLGATTNLVAASSTDGGSSYARTTLNGATTARVADPRLVASGGVLHAAWRDDRASAATGVFTRRSTDGGATWAAEVSVPLGVAKTQVSSLALSAAGSKVAVAVSAQDQGTARLVPVVACSSDGGATFPVTNALPQGTTDSVRNPQLASQGSGVFASWSETAYASGERGALSTDSGATFATGASVSASATSDGLFGPSRAVVAGSGCFYVVWEEARGSATSASHLWVVVAR